MLGGYNYIGEALEKLNQLGISIAMDDFGTGYSSLSYLREYPFGVLEVDRSFVVLFLDCNPPKSPLAKPCNNVPPQYKAECKAKGKIV